jgi:hypothetical protein
MISWGLWADLKRGGCGCEVERVGGKIVRGSLFALRCFWPTCGGCTDDEQEGTFLAPSTQHLEPDLKVHPAICMKTKHSGFLRLDKISQIGPVE